MRGARETHTCACKGGGGQTRYGLENVLALVHGGDDEGLNRLGSGLGEVSSRGRARRRASGP